MKNWHSHAQGLAVAVIAYDKAIQACANDPENMASFCTATGDNLDSLYHRMLERAKREADEIVVKAGKDAEALIARRGKMAEEKIAAEERSAVAKLRGAAADAATKAAAALIAERHDAKSDSKLVDQAIGDIAK